MARFSQALIVLFLCFSTAFASSATAKPFAIHVIDDQTGRGVPLVELSTTNRVSYWTDSNGIAAIDEPSFEGRKVFFSVSSHGYEYPADGLGSRGKTLEVVPGGTATLKIKRLNIAERLYRVTGEGIYRDSILTGEKVPIQQPLLNGLVMGQDSVQSALYHNQIFWFWGDTARPSYPLGHFGTSGATSKLPGHGGLDPAKGIDLTYFVDQDGFSRPMCENGDFGGNMKWIDGLMVLPDPQGHERLIATYARMKSLGEALDCGLILFNDKAGKFEKLKTYPLDNPLHPAGHPFHCTVDGTDYFYFPIPYPTLRVKADWQSVLDFAQYESFTCLKPGTRYNAKKPALDRDAQGHLVWAWKKNTAPLHEDEQDELIQRGLIRKNEAWFAVKDAATGKAVQWHGGSVAWNDYRKRWIAIQLQAKGSTSNLGEVWYSEAEKPEGPWRYARKIVTHDRYSFYNPAQHPFFDQQNGRLIYFEGTYANTFSREGDATPRYDYNQIMYRLDLADPRLKLPQ